jgi:hypothetical protein
MRAADNTTTAAVHGLEWASFLMGIPTSMAIDTNDSGTWSTRYRALYFQDDWRVSGRLRLMFGIRYEREGGITERFNRAIAGGFLYDAKLPITDGAQAAYAANPLPELPASQFKVLGGTEYLSPSHRTYSDGTHKMLPRVSAVVQVNPKTVVRAGYGWYYDTFNVNNTRPNQYGYSQPTSTTISSDLGMSFCCGVGAAENIGAGRMPVTDPFPVRADGTRFDAPYRDSLGLSAFTGRGLTFTARDFSPAFQQRWRLSVQRELAKNMVVDVSYNGAWAKIPVDQRIDYLPKQYWATGTVRDTALDNELNRNVTNPFSIANFAALRTSNPVVYSYLSTQGFFTSSTIRKHQLLRAYPQANGLRGVRPGFSFADTRGGNRYHDMQIQFQRRLTAGLQTEAMYTYAFGEVQDVYFNEFDAAPSWRPSADARPHRLVWSAIYEMPFGKGKKWLSNGFARYIAGDWQASWIYQYQSGPPTSWNNLFYYGDVASIGSALKHDQTHSNDIHLWFDPSIAYRGTGAIPSGFTGFEGRAANQPGAFQVRMFPVMLDTLRADGIRNWDVRILRRFPIRERFGVSVSADLLNITNHTNFAAPVTGATSTNFGRVTAQNGAPRRIQLNLRIEF